MFINLASICLGNGAATNLLGKFCAAQQDYLNSPYKSAFNAAVGMYPQSLLQMGSSPLVSVPVGSVGYPITANELAIQNVHGSGTLLLSSVCFVDLIGMLTGARVVDALRMLNLGSTAPADIQQAPPLVIKAFADMIVERVQAFSPSGDIVMNHYIATSEDLWPSLSLNLGFDQDFMLRLMAIVPLLVMKAEIVHSATVPADSTLTIGSKLDPALALFLTALAMPLGTVSSDIPGRTGPSTRYASNVPARTGTGMFVIVERVKLPIYKFSLAVKGCPSLYVVITNKGARVLQSYENGLVGLLFNGTYFLGSTSGELVAVTDESELHTSFTWTVERSTTFGGADKVEVVYKFPNYGWYVAFLLAMVHEMAGELTPDEAEIRAGMLGYTSRICANTKSIQFPPFVTEKAWPVFPEGLNIVRSKKPYEKYVINIVAQTSSRQPVGGIANPWPLPPLDVAPLVALLPLPMTTFMLATELVATL